ncbi:class I SAM-dependent methyltransferase [Zooshikella harenae]|uniref:Class I SAM-dependent methyltransferase n=1 Tax=Zooshikella harenae TaxID=2827238 RepID=A0ABS5ZIM5_9GAMM|nr:class I SAM-dependent methyltransferase [Zooshikella harenae]MBU2713882.1 class I SAM-dependent methyltransferase [Zooshikella harenae]
MEVETSKLFDDKADLYASARPLYPKVLFDFVASLVITHDKAWDCATGNGQAAIGLAKNFSKVEATDISKEQIANAFQAENINYSAQPGESTNFRNNQFDLVNVAQALHWFDYDRFWDEVSRVLKPTGVFVAYSYVWPHINDNVDHIIDVKVKSVIEPYWAPNNKLAWDSYSSLDLPFKTIATPNINLENHWDLDQFLSYIHTWSGTRRCIDDIGSSFFEEARKALQSVWGDTSKKMVVKNPLTIIAGSAWL